MRSTRRSRGGWRDTDIWLDPDEIVWFGEVARKVRVAAPATPALAGAGFGSAALPVSSTRVEWRRRAPSRRRRLATRLFPTVAAVTVAAGGTVATVASRAAEPLVEPATGPSTPTAAPRPAFTPPAIVESPVAAAYPVPEPGAGPAAPAGIVEASPAKVAKARPAFPEIRWLKSQAIGVPHDGRLVDGVRLPVEGPDWVTWDPVRHRSPNRANRLFGTDTLVRVLLDVVGEYRLAHPKAPRIVIGDLSLRNGGEIDDHVSHENGLDVDVYYPRLDGKLRPPRTVDQIDLRLAQDLVDRFVAAGAQVVFVGFSTPLRGPRDVVVPYSGHDNHLHVRLAPAA